MASKAKRPKRPKRPRRSNKQKVWDYMRRNRQFRAGDIMMILDVGRDFLMPIFRALELSGYIELESTATESFNDRHYKMLKNTGILSPVVLKRPCDIVRDENTGEEFILDGSNPVQIADKLRLLGAMRKKAMTRERIAKNAGMHPYSAKVFRYLEEFTEAGIMERFTRVKNTRFFCIYHDKRDSMIKKLGGAV